MKKLNLLLQQIKVFLYNRYGFTGSCLKQEFATFTPNNIINLFILYELDRWLQDLNAAFSLKHCLSGAIKLNKNADPNEYSYSGYGIRFDSHSLFSIPNFDWGKMLLFLELI